MANQMYSSFNDINSEALDETPFSQDIFGIEPFPWDFDKAVVDTAPGRTGRYTQKNSTLYQPLGVDNYEFRVLSISPDANSSPIRCTLRKTSFINEGTAASNNALSYCWGDPNVRSEIFLNDVQTTATTNLYDALWQLRAIKITKSGLMQFASIRKIRQSAVCRYGS